MPRKRRKQGSMGAGAASSATATTPKISPTPDPEGRLQQPKGAASTPPTTGAKAAGKAATSGGKGKSKEVSKTQKGVKGSKTQQKSNSKRKKSSNGTGTAEGYRDEMVKSLPLPSVEAKEFWTSFIPRYYTFVTQTSLAEADSLMQQRMLPSEPGVVAQAPVQALLQRKPSLDTSAAVKVDPMAQGNGAGGSGGAGGVESRSGSGSGGGGGGDGGGTAVPEKGRPVADAATRGGGGGGTGAARASVAKVSEGLDGSGSDSNNGAGRRGLDKASGSHPRLVAVKRRASVDEDMAAYEPKPKRRHGKPPIVLEDVPLDYHAHGIAQAAELQRAANLRALRQLQRGLPSAAEGVVIEQQRKLYDVMDRLAFHVVIPRDIEKVLAEDRAELNLKAEEVEKKAMAEKEVLLVKYEKKAAMLSKKKKKKKKKA